MHLPGVASMLMRSAKWHQRIDAARRACPCASINKGISAGKPGPGEYQRGEKHRLKLCDWLDISR